VVEPKPVAIELKPVAIESKPDAIESKPVAIELKLVHPGFGSKPFIDYRGIRIFSGFLHLDRILEAIVNAPKFKNWIDKLIDARTIQITEFTVTDCDFFGPVVPERLGFVKGFGNPIDIRTGQKVPSNIVFIRGGSVAVLIIVKVINPNNTFTKKIILCEQVRFPTGKCLIEACAGMLDDKVADSQVLGVVFNELKEEAGFIVKAHELIPLGKIIPSGGGCDEEISLFAWETTISYDEFIQKQNTVFGDSQESIKLRCFDFNSFDDALDEIGDVKAECAWRRYLRWCRMNRNI
jgi:ADP-sugar diphosphatase